MIYLISRWPYLHLAIIQKINSGDNNSGYCEICYVFFRRKRQRTSKNSSIGVSERGVPTLDRAFFSDRSDY